MMEKKKGIKQLKNIDNPLVADFLKSAKKQKYSKKTVYRILAYARASGCIIHPMGLGYYAQNYDMFGCCPCDSKRLMCPCQEAAQELHEQGHCLCRLFWRSMDTFMEKQGWNTGG